MKYKIATDYELMRKFSINGTSTLNEEIALAYLYKLFKWLLQHFGIPPKY